MGIGCVALGAQLVDQLAALAFELAQARIDHRRLDEILRGARAREALPRAQAIDRAAPVAQCGARFGLRAHRAQGLALAIGARRQFAPRQRVGAVAAGPALQRFALALQARGVARPAVPPAPPAACAAASASTGSAARRLSAVGRIALRDRQLDAEQRPHTRPCAPSMAPAATSRSPAGEGLGGAREVAQLQRRQHAGVERPPAGRPASWRAPCRGPAGAGAPARWGPSARARAPASAHVRVARHRRLRRRRCPAAPAPRRCARWSTGGCAGTDRRRCR